MTETKYKEIPTWLWIMLGIAIAIAGVLLILYFWHFHNGFAEGQDVWGQFGDYVGGILNPLFSLTALFALLHTIQLQSKELHDSTEHLEKSSKALAKQYDVMLRQQFENTFFQMLGLFNEVVRGLRLEKGIEGKLCMTKLRLILINDYLSNTDEKDLKFKPREKMKNDNGTDYLTMVPPTDTYQYHDIAIMEAVNMEYHRFHSKYGNLLGQYFRTLYYIIEYIDKSNLPDKDKKFYSNIVRAQLSNDELVLLFYNYLCLDDYWRGKFLPLVKKYDLLEHLNNDYLANPAHRDLLQF